MDPKIKNTLIILTILIFIVLGSGLYTFVLQKGDIDERKNKIKELNLNAYNTADLIDQLNALKARSAELDSILNLRKFNIPVSLSQSSFYDFVNKVSFGFSPHSFVNIEYTDTKQAGDFMFYKYDLSGVAFFNDLYKLIYAIEQSKELKKILMVAFNDFVKVDDEKNPYYLVNYKISVAVYYSFNADFASKVIKENSLVPNPIYDIFYPLIRNEIPPNTDNLLDVQNATLLALIPDGAFIADGQGTTYLLWEGDQVYLGYLTEIDFDNSTVRFILNKGGIIDKVELTLAKENNKRKIQ
ncbi:MAG: hypothetical protein KJ571_15670 [Bacteroidetes bacterium]|nr:hypothetical protein [Bacteroidota bacterium]